MYLFRGILIFVVIVTTITIPAMCKRTVKKASKMSPSVCNSAIPESERIDCAGDVAEATVGICRSRDCVWCPTAVPNIPYCFYDNSSNAAYVDFLKSQCKSCSYCPHAKDCHPEPGATEKKCIARGCQWCSYNTDISCGPMCMYAETNNLNLVRLNCPNCTQCAKRIDCHPEENADAGKCLKRGCRWCPDPTKDVPYCIFSDIPNVITEARKMCNSCSNCQARIDCHPEVNASSTACVSRNCIWCPTTEANQPYCVYGGSTSVTQNYCRGCTNADCNTKIPCPPNVPNATQLQCETYGCMWCPLKSFGEKCVHALA